jgi:hypothetical protein
LSCLHPVVWLAAAALVVAGAAATADNAPVGNGTAIPAASPTESMWQFGERDKLCLAWTDGCRRVDAATFNCSNVGTACLQQDIRCTARMSDMPK